MILGTKINTGENAAVGTQCTLKRGQGEITGSLCGHQWNKTDLFLVDSFDKGGGGFIDLRFTIREAFSGKVTKMEGGAVSLT